MRSKKLTSALLVCAMVFALLPLSAIPAGAVEPLTLILGGNDTAGSGDTYTLSVSLSGVTDPVGALAVTVNFPGSLFTFDSASAAGGTTGFSSSSSSGAVSLAWGASDNSTGNITAGGQIATVTLKVKADAAASTDEIKAVITSALNVGGSSTLPYSPSQVGKEIEVTDDAAPVINVGFARTSSTKGTITINSNEAGTFYYLVTEATAAVPSKSELVNSKEFAAGTTNKPNVTVPSSACRLYYYAEDDAGNETSVSYADVPAVENIPNVTLSFYRMSQTQGILYVTSDSAGKFYFTVYPIQVTPPTTNPISIAAGIKTITIENLPLTSTKVWYRTSDASASSFSPVSSYAIAAYSGSGDTVAPSVYSISANRSSTASTTVNVTVTVSEACTFYYRASGGYSDTGYSSVPLSAGVNNFDISNVPTTFIYLFYYAVDASGNSSPAGAFSIIGDVHSVAPSITNAMLITLSSDYAMFTFTASEACDLYYAASTYTTATKSSLPFIRYRNIQAGDNYVMLPIELFSMSNTRLYYYAKDADGNESQLYYVLQNTGGSTLAPSLANINMTVNPNNPTTGALTFTSNKAGYIYYAVSTSATVTKSTLIFTGYSAINSGANSVAVSSATLPSGGARVYYYTRDIYGNESPLGYVIVSSGGSASAPALTGAYLSTNPSNPSLGAFTFASNKAGYVYYAVSTSASETKNSLIFSGYAITTGSNIIMVGSTLLSSGGARLYYYAKDGSGNESALSYIFPNSIGDTSSITAVSITNVIAPKAGYSPSTGYTIANSDTRYTVSSANWYLCYTLSNLSQNIKLSSSDKFRAGEQYYIAFVLNAKPGYSFPTDSQYFTSLTINGKVATILSLSSSSVTVAYLFDRLAGSASTIGNVAVGNIAEPELGKTPDTSGTTGSSAYSIYSIVWQPSTSKFAADGDYTVIITLVAADGYVFGNPGDLTVTVNSVRSTPISVSKDGSTLVISHTYTLEDPSSEANWKNPYSDVAESSPYYIYIKYSYLHNLFYGTSANAFSPTATMTRAMFVTVLGRMASANVTANPANEFTDVITNSWYAPYVGWATQNGIVLGYGNGKFGPEDPVTREQMCVFLLRYARYAGITLGYAQKSMYGFADASMLSSWAKEAVSIFEQAGVAVTKPNAAGFEPTANAVRQEIAQILSLFMMKYMNG